MNRSVLNQDKTSKVLKVSPLISFKVLFVLMKYYYF